MGALEASSSPGRCPGCANAGPGCQFFMLAQEGAFPAQKASIDDLRCLCTRTRAAFVCLGHPPHTLTLTITIINTQLPNNSVCSLPHLPRLSSCKLCTSCKVRRAALFASCCCVQSCCCILLCRRGPSAGSALAAIVPPHGVRGTTLITFLRSYASPPAQGDHYRKFHFVWTSECLTLKTLLVQTL